MQTELQQIQTRLNEYDAELQEIIREYGDEQSMSYFSDRFGPDHPRSARADEGVRIQQRLYRMRFTLAMFAGAFVTEFPPLRDEST